MTTSQRRVDRPTAMPCAFCGRQCFTAQCHNRDWGFGVCYRCIDLGWRCDWPGCKCNAAKRFRAK